MGVASFKMFMTYDHRVSDSFIAKVMEIVGANGGIVQLHAENGDVIEHLMDKAIAEGRTKPTDFPATCPPWAEAEAINRGILMGAMTDCPMYIVHLTTQLGLERIKEAQRQGQRVWTETCPQYLLLDETAMERLGPFAKIGPPLRPADGVNQNALWDGTENGYISTIGSDHSPAPTEMKEQGWDNIFRAPNGDPIPFGAPSIETIVPLMYSEGVAKRNLPIWWMARMLAENPARIFGLYPRKGVIQPGSDADLLIIDPDAEVTIQAKNHQSTTGFTPYEDWKLTGKPWMTLLRGKVLLNDGKLEQQPGSGEFIAAGKPIPPIAGKVR
jgi:dihydropyrimidinase